MSPHRDRRPEFHLAKRTRPLAMFGWRHSMGRRKVAGHMTFNEAGGALPQGLIPSLTRAHMHGRRGASQQQDLSPSVIV